MKRYVSIYESQTVSSKTTAIKRNKLAQPIEDWIAKGYFDNCNTILDFGAGRGDNVRLLQERLGDTKQVFGYEPHPHSPNPKIISSYSLLDSHYDCVYSTFVLNVVPKDIQDKIVSQMVHKSSKIVIATRDDLLNEMKKMTNYKGMDKKELYDIAIQGYMTGKDRYQRLVTDIPGFKEVGSKKGKYRIFVKM